MDVKFKVTLELSDLAPLARAHVENTFGKAAPGYSWLPVVRYGAIDIELLADPPELVAEDAGEVAPVQSPVRADDGA